MIFDNIFEANLILLNPIIMKASNFVFFFSLVLFFSSLQVANSQVYKDTVQVVTAGTLNTLIPSTDMLTITELKVTGTINGDDIYFLKQNTFGSGNGKLTSIDLSETSIVSGGNNLLASENKFPSYAFSECSQLISITLPTAITSIGSSAFHGCLSLKSMVIPDSVTVIEDYAMTNCSTLVSVKFPKKLKTIGRYSFSNCIALDTVNLPEGTTSLGYRSFWTCLAVKSVTLPQSIRTIGEGTFFMWRQIQSIVIPDSVTTLGDYSFTSSYKLESVHLPSKLTNLGTEAFFACVALKSINWPTGLKSIGDHAFSRCFALTSVELPEGLTSIGSGAFETDFNLTTVALPNSLPNLNTDAFRECYVLKSVKLPTGLTSISPYAFKSCYLLNSIELPAGVKTIGSYAFGSCKAMKQVKLPTSITTISSSAFDSVAFETITCEGPMPASLSSNSFFAPIRTTCKVVVPSGSLAAYRAANYWKDFVQLGYAQIPSILLNIKLADNGFLKQKVTKDSTFTCYLVAAEGWKINTVLLNDSDVTSRMDTAGLFTTPPLTQHSTLSISFEQVMNSSNNVTSRSVKVYSEDHSIVVKGASVGTTVTIFSMSGRLLHAVKVNSDIVKIPVVDDQVYLIRTLDKQFKLAL